MWRAENVANYLIKGKQVYVEGRLQTRQYEDRDGKKQYFTEVVADDLILLGGGGGEREGEEGGGSGYAPAPRREHPRPRDQSQPQPDDMGGGQGINDDDVPF